MFQVRRKVIDFRGAYAPPVVGSRQGEFCKKITGSGPPTVQASSGGTMDLALEATSEIQNACFYQGDVLPWDIDSLIRVEFLVGVTASIGAAVTASFGLASARNDALASIADRVLFKLLGNNNIVIDTSDGTTTNTSIATGETLGLSWKRFVMDFKSNFTTKSPPSASLGGKSNVGFFVDNGNGNLRQVAQNQLFDVTQYGGNLQLFAQVQKTAATSVTTLSLAEIVIEYRMPN